ncbi:MAG: hypothetical protein V4666_02890 [Bacteroidota bacterium]
MKYFVLLAFLIVSCKSIELNGLATNAKDGACIISDNQVYIVKNIDVWQDSINNKKVEAIIKVKRVYNTTIYDLNNNGEMSQGRLGKTIVVKLKDIKIVQ